MRCSLVESHLLWSYTSPSIRSEGDKCIQHVRADNHFKVGRQSWKAETLRAIGLVLKALMCVSVYESAPVSWFRPLDVCPCWMDRVS